jgi:cell division protein FtsB
VAPSRPSRRRRPSKHRQVGRPRNPSRPGRSHDAAASASVRRARLFLLGAVVFSAVVLVAWFPAASLIHQRATLSQDASQLATLHAQDAALAQEKQNLSSTSELGRIARAQYQLVNPGQQAYEVLPPSGATAAGTPYAGDPGSKGPVAPSASSELPPGGVTTTIAPPASGTASHGAGTGSSSPAQGGGLLSRMVQALEFWR